MLTYTTEERLAMLLSALGEDASKAAFKSMNPTRANYVKKLLAEFQADPPNSEEIEYVVQDFNTYFSFAMDTLSPQVAEAEQTGGVSKSVEKGTSGNSSSKNRLTYFTPVEPTGEIVEDINKLDPFQIATTLVGDHPKTIALVLRNLDTPLAAMVLENLDESTREEAVILLSRESSVPERIVENVLVSTFEKANEITTRKEKVEQSETLAELLRSLPKDIRKTLMDRLLEENKDLVDQIRSKLYVFEDLLRLGDRDIQKVLGQVETESLIVGLQKADPAILKLLFSNLSKRARQTIEEEMEYKTDVSEEEIEEARQMLVDAVGQLDESGDITLSLS